MRFLISEMLLLLIASFALGLAVGALLGRAQRRPQEPTELETELARLRSVLRRHDLDPDLPDARMEITTLGELEPAPPELIDLEPDEPEGRE